jgi:hypothetical protein
VEFAAQEPSEKKMKGQKEGQKPFAGLKPFAVNVL